MLEEAVYLFLTSHLVGLNKVPFFPLQFAKVLYRVVYYVLLLGSWFSTRRSLKRYISNEMKKVKFTRDANLKFIIFQ